ncbi:cytochrome P450 2F2-like [Rhincodon typus]|uniref:cytochrome P450 2F2-like n=1 Tax=Rhincodon typus TaxID=259920 RepID=UPI00202E6A7F|nr:cytochrome P450 2F2-like [Rhincodon typus]
MELFKYFPTGYTSVLWLLALSLLLIVSVIRRRVPRNFPPGPTPLPLIGNLHQLDLRRLDWSLMGLAEKYGSVFSVEIGPQKAVVLSSYDAVNDALVKHADLFTGRPHIPIFNEFSLRKGVIFSDGKLWQDNRKFVISALRDFGMGKKSIEDRITEEASFLVNVFESHKGQPFETAWILSSAVSNIICSMLFGDRFDYDDEIFIQLISMINENTRLSGTVPLHACVSSGDLHPSFSQSYSTHKRLLEKVQQRYWSQEETAVFEKIKEKGKVQEEIDQLIGAGRSPVTEDRKLMPYTDAVIHEIQRFANIVPLNLPHSTTEDTHIKGHFIPKGTYVIPVLTSVLRDKTQWKTPNEFNPAHFLDADGNFVKRDAFMPFSAGQRVCAGEALAKLELFLFFTTLLQKFHFQAPPGVTDLDTSPRIGLVTNPKPHRVCAVPR